MRYYVYILTNKSNTLYIGVTNNLIRRIYEHKHKFVGGFTKRYNIDRLLYLEEYSTAIEAITREKQLKGWTRKRKMALIKTMNPEFNEIDIIQSHSERSEESLSLSEISHARGILR